MLDLFKKKVTPNEFGQVIVQWSADFLASDAGRSSGMHFDNYDASDGWGKFLERRGMPHSLLRLHFMLYTHCALQAASTEFDEGKRRGITQGAISGALQVKPDGYDFDAMYITLEAVYRGHHNWARFGRGWRRGG